jgi:pseudaminic acid synthase
MDMKPFKIGSNFIGSGHPCYVVAEISANHNQDFGRALQIIEAARAAGANAIKLQTYTADTLTIDSSAEWFQIRGDSLWAGKTLHELYGEAYTPWAWHADLFRAAKEQGLDCFSSPFDFSAVDFLESLDSPAYKVASFEIVDIPLLEYIGKTRKPVIVSTGMATLEEIGEAVTTLRNAGSSDIALLKCTSAYPAPPEAMNLRTIAHLRDTFKVVTGLSDHTLGSCVAVAAVALGASIIEKHFTLNRSDGGPDAAFSMEPHEFAKMVEDIRTVERALGEVSYSRTDEEKKNVSFRRSLFVVENIKAGDVLTTSNIRSIRPGNGLLPRHLKDVLGKRAKKDLARGTPLSWDVIADGFETTSS